VVTGEGHARLTDWCRRVRRGTLLIKVFPPSFNAYCNDYVDEFVDTPKVKKPITNELVPH